MVLVSTFSVSHLTRKVLFDVEYQDLDYRGRGPKVDTPHFTSHLLET